MTTTATDEPAIYSAFGADPLLGEMVEMYVAEMPARIETLGQAFSSGDRPALRRAAHQMKGAAGSYGFDPLTQAAAVLESAIDDSQPRDIIASALDALVQLCRRIRAGTSAGN